MAEAYRNWGTEKAGLHMFSSTCTWQVFVSRFNLLNCRIPILGAHVLASTNDPPPQ